MNELCPGALEGGLEVNGKEMAELAGLTPQAISRAGQNGPLSSARTPTGKLRLDSKSAWDFLAAHPIPKGTPQKWIDEFLAPAENEEDPQLLDPIHPRMIAYFARTGGDYQIWGLKYGDLKLDLGTHATLAALKKAALKKVDQDVANDMLVIASNEAGAWSGCLMARRSALRALCRAHRLTVEDADALAPKNGKLPAYVNAGSQPFELQWWSVPATPQVKARKKSASKAKKKMGKRR